MPTDLKTLAFADDQEPILQVLKTACKNYQILGVARNGMEAVNLVKLTLPQVLLMDLHMPVMDGLAALKEIVSLGTTAVVMITADSDPSIAKQAMALGACGYLSKPLEAQQIIPTLESAWSQYEAQASLRREIQDLHDNLETRKLLEKAKGILMEQQGMSEEQAHKTLQKMSQDQAITLKEVCRSLIQVRALLGKVSQKRVA